MPRCLPIFILFLLVSACSSAPREVNASLPLVASSSINSQHLVSNGLAAHLSNDDIKHINYKGYEVALSNKYFSALGQLCRKLSFYDNKRKLGNKTFCSFEEKPNLEKTWRAVKDIALDKLTVEL
ncbi:MAG: hypothetical protein HAW67_01625 [Endozoicomonadaceae bacterium]|nr:hypothetical protein [Endozoicomonadaceae bacterium]